MTVIAKMVAIANSPKEHSTEGMHTIQLGGVWQDPANNPDAENAIFGKATPMAHFVMGIVNPDAIKYFDPGAEYYVEFKRVPGSKSYVEQAAEREKAKAESQQ